MQRAKLPRPRARRAGALRRMARVSPWDNDEVLREELFSIERLEEHALTLAVAQRVTRNPIHRPPLAVRLSDNEAVLLRAYRAIAQVATEGGAITPAAEWLLDNYHLVETQIREIREDLPPGFYRQLPKLASGPFRGYPRVFGIAWAFVAHTDSYFDPESLRRFVRAYQTVQPLTIGELWAVAITLRIVLVENLRRAAHLIVSGREARQEADDIADRLLGLNGYTTEPGALIKRYEGVATLPANLVVQLMQRLRDQDPRITPAVMWLEERLAAQGTTADAVVRDEHRRLGGSNVTVRNAITSMRLISELEWSEFFESVSLVDDALRAGSDLAQMDFVTRNLYRSRIEELSRGSKLTELEITRAVITAGNSVTNVGGRRGDPGYHLIGSGRFAFEMAIGYRAPLRRLPGRWVMRHGAGAYIGAILLVAAVVLATPLLATDLSESAAWKLALLGLLGLTPALDAAIALVNRAVAGRFSATILPGLALREGVPPELRTLVAIPALLTSTAAIEDVIERLEIHYLASPEGALHFALLSDWVDADAEHTDADEPLLTTAAQGIAQLNARYAPGKEGGNRFMLLHRRRVWCEVQQQWMGWERKRGKLHELNRLLRGATDTTFLDVDGQQPTVPPEVRFVITLDADTQLPRETVRRLIGKLAHPLNQPRFDAAAGRVVEGHAVLQPRVTPSLPVGREGSIFQRIVSSAPGLDPYAAAVSDVYQDLFGEGSYCGKGIYDVDAFEAALAGRARDGTLLSHDLFEGIFARAGLVSDIEVVEEFPARYDVDAARQHRWARGDWQLLPWLLGRHASAGDDRRRSRIPLIGFWKMFDNLRRTLSAPASVGALVVGWTLPLRSSLIWTAFILATIALPTLLPVVAAIVPRGAGISARSYFRTLGKDSLLAARRMIFQVTFLPHRAYLMADAISRTLYRLIVSRRNLLEWVTAEQASLRSRLDMAGVYRRMSGGVIVTLGAVVIDYFAGSGAGWVGAPFAVLWIAAPAVALWISRSPRVASDLPVTDASALELRLVARRTWRFFEEFVTADDHMLPPDNFQEDPAPVLARRTSPTNIGLYLLSAVSARDLGWTGTVEAVERLEATLKTMGQLEKRRGHLYNWYDTRDLRPLDPQYISSVDSGNLAAHLVTVANAAQEWTMAGVSPGDSAAGARDALHLARETLGALPAPARSQSVLWQQLKDQFNDIDTGLREIGSSGNDLTTRLQYLASDAATVVDIAQTLASDGGVYALGDLLFWCDAFHRSIVGWQNDIAQTPDEARALNQRLLVVAATTRAMATAMDFGFLFRPAAPVAVHRLPRCRRHARPQ